MKWKLRRTCLIAGTLVLVGLVSAGTIAGEGIDLMRQITSQWIKPNIMLVIDRSGSMNWPVETNSTTYNLRYTDSTGKTHRMDPQVGYDYTQLRSYGPYYRTSSRAFPNLGTGHGYWVKLDKSIDWTKLKKVFLGSEESVSISATSWQRDRIYVNWIWTYQVYDLLYISDVAGSPELEGLYEISGVDNGNSFIRVRKVAEDGIRDSTTNFVFPTAGATLNIQRVRIGVNNINDMAAREPAKVGFYDASYNYLLFVQRPEAWYRGDLIRVSGMPDSADDGLYLIQSTFGTSWANPGYYRFSVSRVDSNLTWDWNDPDATMSSASDSAISIQRVLPQSTPLPGGAVWYYVPPSRMAITKNVLGQHIWLYEVPDALSPAGTDDAGRPYYTFSSGAGPDSGTGAYYDWYLKAWVSWSEAEPTAEPVPDHNYTDALEPSDLVREFSDVINWGLTAYSGSCDGQDLLVSSSPDDGDQLASVEAIEVYLDIVPNSGLNPGGTTPTRDALQRAREALLIDADSTWSRDTRRTCDRTYGVILMTDGVSNQCNPRDGEWSSCYDSWESYPAGKSNQLWDGEDDAGTFLTHVRTWVIGVSPAVGRCELNFTAYKGRTDSNSPEGDAGFDTEADPRLPEGDPGDYDASLDYAYFTNSAQELKDAYADIVTSMGAGGYSTAAPTVSAAAGPTGGAVSFISSTYYPTWEGHLQALNLELDPNSDTDVEYWDDDSHLIWDAADLLSSSLNPNGGFARRIYTWDPSQSNELVEVTTINTSRINTICGSCSITDQVVDFIRGGDGSGTLRRLQMGPIINSTPTVIGRPQQWDQNTVHEHSSFETTYRSRHSLIWVGTSDGTLRAFDVVDGAEILCLIPPTMLDHQVELYMTYLSNPSEYPLGQEQLPSRHKYGIASSPRFGDVYFSSTSSYKTVLLIGEGPGGSGLHAIDVTHPYPGRTIDGTVYNEDPNYGYGISTGDPVKVLWSKSGDGEAGTTLLTGLGKTWSMPAIGPVTDTTWRAQIGAGYLENDANLSNPKVFFFNPTNGEAAPGNFTQSSPALANSATFWVSNQSFADAVYWKNTSNRFEPDDRITEGVQGDLNGHLWRLTQQGNSMERSLLLSIVDEGSLGDPEPIYYCPAVNGFQEPVRYSMYAFATGSYYETSPSIVGSDVGTAGNFIPKIFIVTRDLDDSSIDYIAIPTGDLPLPIDPDNPEAGSPGTLGPRTQPTTSPMIFTPNDSMPTAVFLLYDPDATTCVGISYIVTVTFNPEDLTLEPDIKSWAAGEGTSGGFAVSGGSVVVAQSKPIIDELPILVKVPELHLFSGADEENVLWWIELQ